MTDLRPSPLVPAADALGEVPVWCWRTARLWWVDVLAARLHEYDPASGAHRLRHLPFRRLGSIALHAAGGLVLATETGLHRFDPDSGSVTPLVDPIAGQRGMRLNDGRCDRAGRFWVGSMNDGDFVPEGTLFRVTPDLGVTAMQQGIIVPNAIAFSPDDRTFYFADTRRYTIWAYDFDLESGRINNQRVLATTSPPARPDGACVDTDGCLWNAAYGGGQIVRYTPAGRIDRTIALPVMYPTCCTFGGPDLRTLFITSARFPLSGEALSAEPDAGNLFAIETGSSGMPEPQFGA